MSHAMPSPVVRERHVSVWAYVFITAGVIWLLRNAGILSIEQLSVLFRLWPLLLIIVGVQLLVGKRNTLVGQVVIIGGIVIVVGLMLIGPSLGLAADLNIRSLTTSEPLGSTQSARVNLAMSIGGGSVYALSDTDQLVTADLRYIGEANLDVREGSEALITLSNETTGNTQAFGFLGLTLGENDLYSHIGLSPSIPLELSVSGGVGSTSLDLSGLQLSNLNFNSGVGDTTISLPASADGLNIEINGGVGKNVLIVPEGATIRADISGGVGDMEIDLPDDAAVRVDASGGLNSFSFPASWTRVSGENDDGVWESPAYRDAAIGDRIEIDYNAGVGSLRVH